MGHPSICCFKIENFLVFIKIKGLSNEIGSYVFCKEMSFLNEEKLLEMCEKWYENRVSVLIIISGKAAAGENNI